MKKSFLLVWALLLSVFAPSAFALTNSFTTVTATFDQASNAFDWGLTTGLAVLAVAIIIGWVKFGLRSAMGSKKA